MTVALRPRSRRWRTLRAARAAVMALVVAPFVALVPPHAPWLIGALVLGAIFVRRAWSERFTIAEARGACPRCGEEIEVPEGTRLKQPLPVSCDVCRHEPALVLERG